MRIPIVVHGLYRAAAGAAAGRIVMRWRHCGIMAAAELA